MIALAVYPFIAAGLQAMRALSHHTAGAAGHLLLALAGAEAVAWPGTTALALVLFMGSSWVAYLANSRPLLASRVRRDATSEGTSAWKALEGDTAVSPTGHGRANQCCN